MAAQAEPCMCVAEQAQPPPMAHRAWAVSKDVINPNSETGEASEVHSCLELTLQNVACESARASSASQKKQSSVRERKTAVEQDESQRNNFLNTHICTRFLSGTHVHPVHFINTATSRDWKIKITFFNFMLADVRRVRGEVNLIVGALPVCILPSRQHPTDLLYPRRLQRRLHLCAAGMCSGVESRDLPIRIFLGCAQRCGMESLCQIALSARRKLQVCVQKKAGSVFIAHPPPPILPFCDAPGRRSAAIAAFSVKDLGQRGCGFASRVKELVGLASGAR